MTADLSRFGSQCLDTFSHFIPNSLAVFYRIDDQLQACDFQLRGMAQPMHQAYLSHYREDDPLRPDACQASGRAVLSLEQAMQRQNRSRNLRYWQFLQRHAVVDVVEITVQRDQRPLAGLSLLRTSSLGRFRAAELDDLQPLHALLQQAVMLLPEAAGDPLAGLTARERQLALLLRQGASNKQLACELGLGLPTIKTHLLNLFRKCAVGNRTELVARLFID